MRVCKQVCTKTGLVYPHNEETKISTVKKKRTKKRQVTVKPIQPFNREKRPTLFSLMDGCYMHPTGKQLIISGRDNSMVPLLRYVNRYLSHSRASQLLVLHNPADGGIPSAARGSSGRHGHLMEKLRVFYLACAVNLPTGGGDATVASRPAVFAGGGEGPGSGAAGGGSGGISKRPLGCCCCRKRDGVDSPTLVGLFLSLEWIHGWPGGVHCSRV